MRINFTSPHSLSLVARWLSDLLSCPLLSETQTRYDPNFGLDSAVTFLPSQTRKLTDLGRNTFSYEERYTFSDRAEIIRTAIESGYSFMLPEWESAPDGEVVARVACPIGTVIP